MNDRSVRSPLGTLGAMPLDRLTIVSESDCLSDVAAVFVREGVSCALLQEAPLRVVTERDLAVAWSLEVDGNEPVGTIATDRPFWVPIHASVAEAAAAMVNLGVRHLVVVDPNDHPLGVVSMTDLFTLFVQADEPATLYSSFAALLVRLHRGP